MPILPIILGIASVAGAIGSANGKKYIDSDWLDEHFGNQAFSQKFKEYLNVLQSSPEGQKMFDEAHTLGQQMANNIRANATAAGFGGAEGAQSGGSLFATSVADQATNNLRRQVNAQMSQVAAQQAQDYLNRKMAVMTSDQGRQTAAGATWGAIGQAAGIGINAGWGAPAAPKTDSTPAPKTDSTPAPKTEMTPVARQTAGETQVANSGQASGGGTLALPKQYGMQSAMEGVRLAAPPSQPPGFNQPEIGGRLGIRRR